MVDEDNIAEHPINASPTDDLTKFLRFITENPHTIILYRLYTILPDRPHLLIENYVLPKTRLTR